MFSPHYDTIQRKISDSVILFDIALPYMRVCYIDSVGNCFRRVSNCFRRVSNEDRCMSSRQGGAKTDPVFSCITYPE